jgi:uncharacterized membrane protein YphA (DoxX/SURF4 family)
MTLDPGVGYLLLIALGLLFAHAAWHKWRGLARFREQLAAYRLLPGALLGPFGVAVPLAESAIALLLLPPMTRPWAAAVGAALLLGYAAAMAINLGRGRRDLDCGCAGPAVRRPIAAWMVWRNALLSALLLVASQPLSARTLSGSDLLTVGGGLLALVLLYGALERLLGQIMPRGAALRVAR